VFCLLQALFSLFIAPDAKNISEAVELVRGHGG
jgi:hypothetical protein